MITDYIEQAKPVLTRTGSMAQSYAERIISRLEAIHEAVQSEEFQERRHALPLSIGAGDTTRIGVLRSHESWELEAVAATAASDVSIFMDGVLRWTSAYTGRGTEPGSGVVLTGPGEVTVSSSAAATVVPQFKVKQPKPSRKTIHTGMIEPPAEMLGRGVEEHRHTDAHSRPHQTEPGVVTR